MSDEFPLPVPPSKNKNQLAVELVSGSFGGAAQVISGQPLDTLKTVSERLPGRDSAIVKLSACFITKLETGTVPGTAKR